MTVIDANLLLYAYNADAPQRSSAIKWLRSILASGEPIALPWITIWAFIRICTTPRIWTDPFPTKEAFDIIAGWFELPNVIFLEPGARHFEILQRLAVEHDAGGPMLSDAVLAALAIENGALLASTDRDFARFKGLRWINPLSQ